jgi:hypothetical protein
VGNLKGGELANCAGASDSLVVGFLTPHRPIAQQRTVTLKDLGCRLEFHG